MAGDTASDIIEQFGVLFGAAVAYMSIVAVRVYQALPRR
jgi:hypothetical protein